MDLKRTIKRLFGEDDKAFDIVGDSGGILFWVVLILSLLKRMGIHSMSLGGSSTPKTGGTFSRTDEGYMFEFLGVLRNRFPEEFIDKLLSQMSKTEIENLRHTISDLASQKPNFPEIVVGALSDDPVKAAEWLRTLGITQSMQTKMLAFVNRLVKSNNPEILGYIENAKEIARKINARGNAAYSETEDRLRKFSERRVPFVEFSIAIALLLVGALASLKMQSFFPFPVSILLSVLIFLIARRGS